MYKSEYNLKEWREFREKLSYFDDDTKIIETLNFWASKPIVNYVLDYDKPESWITPWEIITDGYYDDICMMILITETLILSGFDYHRFKLRYVQDSVDNSRFMILIIDGRLVLGFSYNQIVELNDIKNRIKVIQKIKRNDETYEVE